MIAPNLTIRPGDRLDDFDLLDLVATSGMASVYRARNVKTEQQVAIKIPHPEVESDPTLYVRFQREEEIGMRVEHPGVMRVFPNPERSQVYLVMEWLDGQLLRKVMNKEKKLSAERAARITVFICDALQYIHELGVVHRDLKPENIMLDPDDRIHLIDFGIAANAGARRLTFSHFSQNMGTPDYISPEQVRGKRGDARSDIYAVGVMLYEMLTGSVPFAGPNPFAVMNDRLIHQPIPPRELDSSITPQMQEIIYRALERDPKNRYASAREMMHDLLHQSEVGLEARRDPRRRDLRREAKDRKSQRSPLSHSLLKYSLLLLIPLALFVLLVLAAHSK